MTNIRELKKTLPKLEPSPFKLKAKRLQDAEIAQMLEEDFGLMEAEMTREEYYEAMLDDEEIPLSEVKEALVASTTMPAYSKLLESDKQVKTRLKKPSTATVLASIQASSSVENFIPMSRQGGPRHSPVGVPEVDVLSNSNSDRVRSSEQNDGPKSVDTKKCVGDSSKVGSRKGGRRRMNSRGGESMRVRSLLPPPTPF